MSELHATSGTWSEAGHPNMSMRRTYTRMNPKKHTPFLSTDKYQASEDLRLKPEWEGLPIPQDTNPKP